jgi:hypothetical protein
MAAELGRENLGLLLNLCYLRLPLEAMVNIRLFVLSKNFMKHVGVKYNDLGSINEGISNFATARRTTVVIHHNGINGVTGHYVPVVPAQTGAGADLSAPTDARGAEPGAKQAATNRPKVANRNHDEPVAGRERELRPPSQRSQDTPWARTGKWRRREEAAATTGGGTIPTAQGALDLSTLARSQVFEARRVLDLHKFTGIDPRRLSSNAAEMPNTSRVEEVQRAGMGDESAGLHE